MKRDRIILAPPERRELQRRARSRTIRQEDARRARVVLLLASGATWATIQERVGCAPAFINKWNKRFREGRVPALASRKSKGRPPTVLTPAMEARILAETREEPPDGSTHWSTRRLGKHLGVSHSVVHQVWKRAGFQPHRLERYMASNDPDFEEKAADVIGLYLNPPENAVVFSVDEKTAIQALDRTVRVLPMSPGRAERHGFEYYRHGTRSLIAALNIQTGEVRGKTVTRIGGEAFLAFLQEIVESQPPGKEIHVIADNLSAHKTKRVRAFVEANPTFHMHYTPTYSSWLNQIAFQLSFGQTTKHKASNATHTRKRIKMTKKKLFNTQPNSQATRNSGTSGNSKTMKTFSRKGHLSKTSNPNKIAPNKSTGPQPTPSPLPGIQALTQGI